MAFWHSRKGTTMETAERFMTARGQRPGGTNRAQACLGAAVLFYLILCQYIHALYSCRITKCTTLRTDLNVNNELWLIMMYQCWFISFATLVGNVDSGRGCPWGVGRGDMELSVLST